MRSDNVMVSFANFRTKTEAAIVAGQEIEMEKTVNAPYEALKVFGKSEQKAKWYQAEGVTTQAGTPSPESPIDLVSNIPAGSYQLQTPNGIYEVTLTEDLRGIDDTYRDKICFDSVSGTGYLEQNTQKVNMQDKNISNYSGTDDETLHFGMAYDFDKSKVSKNQFICTHFQFVEGAFYNPTEDSMVLYNYTDTVNSLFINIRKQHLDITDYSDRTENVSSFQRWISANSPTVILPMTTPIKTALTFTKVTSSTLPVLPWTAYGNNLFDGVFESGFYDENGAVASTNYIRSANYIAIQPNTLYYFLNNNDDDTFLWYDGGKNFIAQVNDLSAPSPANARYMRFFFYGTDLSTEYMICSGSKPTAFEPFNPTPPESLTPSPDYPHQIYDLSDVTVTSRGSNIADIPDIETLNYSVGMGKYLQWYIDLPLGTEVTVSADVKIRANDSNDWRIQLKDGNTIYLFKPYFNTVNFEGRFSYSHVKTVDFNKEDVNYSLWYFGSSGNGAVLGWAKNITVNIGNTDMGYDKYRSTSATIPLTMRAIETVEENANFSKVVDGVTKYYCCDYIEISGGKVYYNQCVRRFEIPENIVWNWGVGTPKRILIYTNKKIGNNTLGFFTLGISKPELIDITDRNGYIQPYKSNKYLYWYLDYTLFGLDGTEEKSVADARLQEWLAKIPDKYIDFILETPVRTEITDTWAQDLLALKTAPYYTKLLADKETGGLKATYKHF